MSSETGSESDYELDDEFEYHGYRVGRPTRTAEVSAPGGTSTVEEGKLTFELVHKEDMHTTRENDGWTAHYVSPEGGVGFGLDDSNPGGVHVPYGLEGILVFPEPMTEKEADGWLEANPERWKEFVDDSLECDKTARDLLEDLR
jgi:hypothetical protein